MTPLSLTIGPFAIPTSFALLGLSLCIAHLAGWLAGRRQGLSVASHINDILMLGLFSARLGFVAQWWDVYLEKPLGILDIRDGGFNLWTGLAGALLLAFWRMGRRPELRKNLAIASLAGALSWGGGHAWLANQPDPLLVSQPLHTLGGRRATLPELAQGKPLAVNLWASWCPPCRREMPVLQAAQSQASDIAFVFANQNEELEMVQQYLREQNLQLNNVLLDSSGELSKQYGSGALPVTLFFDAEGQLVNSHVGELSKASLESKLESLRQK